MNKYQEKSDNAFEYYRKAVQEQIEKQVALEQEKLKQEKEMLTGLYKATTDSLTNKYKSPTRRRVGERPAVPGIGQAREGLRAAELRPLGFHRIYSNDSLRLDVNRDEAVVTRFIEGVQVRNNYNLRNSTEKLSLTQDLRLDLMNNGDFYYNFFDHIFQMQPPRFNTVQEIHVINDKLKFVFSDLVFEDDPEEELEAEQVVEQAVDADRDEFARILLEEEDDLRGHRGLPF
jgi:hypothetical protein